MDVCLIWTRLRNGAMCRADVLPSEIPDDLPRLRELTSGSPIVMGRRTWESLRRRSGGGRQSIVLTRTPSPLAGAVACATLGEALTMASVLHPPHVFLVGGAMVYRQGLLIADRIFVMDLDMVVGDARIVPPSIDRDLYELVNIETYGQCGGPRLRLLEYRRCGRIH